MEFMHFMCVCVKIEKLRKSWRAFIERLRGFCDGGSDFSDDDGDEDAVTGAVISVMMMMMMTTVNSDIWHDESKGRAWVVTELHIVIFKGTGEKGDAAQRTESSPQKCCRNGAFAQQTMTLMSTDCVVRGFVANA
eukprot:1150408-Pelagomonas_calceolata.AAC.2